MRYLFFDIEGANNYNYIAKMCTFGYVITDDKFKLNTKIDVIINPEAPFDKHILQKKMNAYKVSKYSSCPPFNYFYKSIKKILEEKNQIVVGWAIENDIRFIHDACERYQCKQIKFNYIDLQTVFMKYEKLSMPPSLESACEKYNIKTQVTHKSDDDALATMMIAKELCKKENIKLEELMVRYEECCSSVNEFEKHLISKEELQQKAVRKKIVNFINNYSIKPSLRDKNINRNIIYGFNSQVIDAHIDEINDIVKYVKKCGGKTTTAIRKCNVLICDQKPIDKEKRNVNDEVIKIVDFNEFVNSINIKINN